MAAKNGIEPYDTKKGTRYKARYWKPDGKQGSKGSFETRAAAKAFQLEMEVKRAQGTFVDPAHGRVTVASVAEEWLATREADPATKRSTYARVRGIVRTRIIPDLGEHRIGSVTRGDVNEWIRTLTGEAETVRKQVSVLRGIFEFAIEHNRIHTNPASKVKQPRVPKKQKRYLTDEQIATLYEIVGRTNNGEAHGYDLIVALLAYTGLRWSELAGLRIGDVDLKTRRLSIAHTVVLVDGVPTEGVPKSYSTRSVPIPDIIAALVRTHIVRRREELAVDAKRLKDQLALLDAKSAELERVRARGVVLAARLDEVRERNATLTARIAGLEADRDARAVAGMPTEPVDVRIAAAAKTLSKLPRIEGLEKNVALIPERIARLEKQIAKAPRQAEILRDALRVLEQEPLFVGVRTRSWLRNASFRTGWLTPAVAEMDALAAKAATENDDIPPKPLGDVKPHELRHTYASLAISEGANVKALQRALGHEKASVTLDVYADLFEDDLDDIAIRLDASIRAMSEESDLSTGNPIPYYDTIWDV
ncbi:tyrosine-type recombinase/integrase [Leucobacter sp. UT-8R-CII-1-4]|uniref:tyrosine-type recombinase/integrase n=1 Tax=Leucobacter sp. UT-8R-CII-1-4 TaxID=3040075 RepID=UPI0024A7CA4A|nr:tyrosine-type recombinase/integrase [Leucobacter sp. UT-8R-CII-1-4]MDI6023159.1 tyrosine-type recombinase/integrase [Leucobacter sp. UT-8R-CII-1-4]